MQRDCGASLIRCRIDGELRCGAARLAFSVHRDQERPGGHDLEGRLIESLLCYELRRSGDATLVKITTRDPWDRPAVVERPVRFQRRQSTAHLCEGTKV